MDVNGTLAETERDGHCPAFKQALAEAGLDWHRDEDFSGATLVVAELDQPTTPRLPAA